MDLITNELYLENIKAYTAFNYDWEKLRNKTILITGARGMIGSFLIDIIMELNKEKNLNCTILALARNEEGIKSRFQSYLGKPNFKIIIKDINEEITINEEINYIIQGASNTHPVSYSTDPVGTITTNVIGTFNLLKLGLLKKIDRFIFLSSVEIYGEALNDFPFKEEDMGYINCNSLRSGYPESKRTGEALCQAFREQGLDIVIPRLCRIYGPTMKSDDSKASSQFIKKALLKEDIVLKSKGDQYYSYLYSGDAAMAILFLLFKGSNGEAYNVASNKSNITLKDLAHLLANWAKTKVIFDLPNATEAKGFSKATKAILDSKKINDLGYQPMFTIEEGIKKTLEILEAYYDENK